MVVAEIPLWVAHGGSQLEPDGEDAPAKDSLALLLAKQTKTAIYSVDTSPVANLFATAGGDGTIRLWDTAALFPKLKTSARFLEDSGAYVSSSSGGDSIESISSNDPRKTAEDKSDESKDNTSLGSSRNVVHDLVARRKDGTVIDIKTSAAASLHPASPQKKADNKGRHVCTLTAHTGSSVLCVRFSTSGKLLASAGDDASVCVYGETSHNQWNRTKLCRGHGLDVVDLAWAPDDTHLISCSLDSATPIIVWKLTGSSGMVCSPFKVLGKGVHTSTVKGIAFDPAGSYFASSGDDPAICIWRAHDDWGLEARIDDASIFRQWKDEDSVTQSMFRRLSWATDGSFLCATNAVVKNKHVASTISREGWATGRTATNLVGHRQPVVVCRHSPRLLNARRKDDTGPSDEPEYATLLALGDRRGFVTVWSTKKARPLFKLQCSESRCTVTDLAWGLLPEGSMMLLVSLLDGQMVAMKFSVPEELGPLLSAREKARVFELRYGINTNDDVFVGGTSGPRLIENALQISLEEQQKDDGSSGFMDTGASDSSAPLQINTLVPRSSKNKGGDGKKRLQLELPSAAAGQKEKRARIVDEHIEQPPDRTQNIQDVAQPTLIPKRADSETVPTQIMHAPTLRESLLPTSTSQLHTIELPSIAAVDGASLLNDLNETSAVAQCTNGLKIPAGSQGRQVPCIDLVIKVSAKIMWKDQLPGTSCTALCASMNRLAVGTADGAIQLYGTSSSKGWKSGFSFRSHPPMITGFPVVSLKFRKHGRGDDMLVVSADGSFAVYCLVPHASLRYKGSIFPAMRHMSIQSTAKELVMPKLSRVQMTESDSVFVILSHKDYSAAMDTKSNATPKGQGGIGVGGSLQAFLYDKATELWLRISDSRFALSDFFTTVPSPDPKRTFLAKSDDAVRFGSVKSTLKSSRTRLVDRNASTLYDQLEDESGSFVASRSHCEDRLACSLVLNSSKDFQEWLTFYTRTLARCGMESQLRHLIDSLLGRLSEDQTSDDPGGWLSQSPAILGLDRRELVRSKLLTEIGKNRALQRLATEISMQLDTL